MNTNELLAFLLKRPKGTALPEDPVVRGNLNLYGTDITWLPDNLVVTGNLNLRECVLLADLPANLFVGGDLDITLSCVKALPANLNVRGNIYALNLDLNIPNGFTSNGGLLLGGETGMQDILDTPLRLPDDLTVNGDLDITDRIIKTWPQNLTVKGALKIGTVAIGGPDCGMISISGVKISGLTN